MTQPDATSYHRPQSLDDALRLLGEGAWRIAAGCTDLFPATERKTLPGPILDITGIATLAGIARDASGVRIGATTTWSDVIRADLPPAFDGLKAAAREVGATQIQNRGTIAGNLCNASPAADGVPPLLTLDTRVELADRSGTRSLPLTDFIKGPRDTALRRGEMVTALIMPAPALEGQGAFLKLGARKYLVISITMVAARLTLEQGVVRDAAIAIGAASPVARRLPAAERALIGAPLDPMRIMEGHVAAELAPIDDPRADASYRRDAALELVRRAVAKADPE